MVVIMRPGTEKKYIDELVGQLEHEGLEVGITNGVGCTILGLVGDTTAVDKGKIELNPHVERVMRVQEPFKKANRKFHPDDSVVSVGDAKIGGGNTTGAERKSQVGGRVLCPSRRSGALATDPSQTGADLRQAFEWTEPKGKSDRQDHFAGWTRRDRKEPLGIGVWRRHPGGRLRVGLSRCRDARRRYRDP